MSHPSPNANAGTYAAMLGLIFLGLILLGMVAIVLPQAFGLVLVIGLFATIISLQYLMLHYLMWGQRLFRGKSDPETSTDSFESSPPH